VQNYSDEIISFAHVTSDKLNKWFSYAGLKICWGLLRINYLLTLGVDAIGGIFSIGIRSHTVSPMFNDQNFVNLS